MTEIARPNSLTLVSADTSLAKRATVINGVVTRTDDPHWPSVVTFDVAEVSGPDDMLDVLASTAEDSPAPCVVRADPLSDIGRRALYPDAEKGPAGMRVMPRAWAGYDIEKVPAGGIDPLREPERAVAKVRQCLPPQHHDATVVWQITASAGKRIDELRLRLWFMFDKPLIGRQVAPWCEPGVRSGWLDPVTLRNEVLPHFIAVTIAGDVVDPCPQRWGLIRGERDRVPVPARIFLQTSQESGDIPECSGNLDALQKRYGDQLDTLRKNAVQQIKHEIAEVRAAGDGARHPRYVQAATTVVGLCEFWCIKLDKPRQLLEAAYLETLSPDEARKRERGSTRGVWSWLARRAS
jgi:hypothetical protein